VVVRDNVSKDTVWGVDGLDGVMIMVP